MALYDDEQQRLAQRAAQLQAGLQNMLGITGGTCGCGPGRVCPRHDPNPVAYDYTDGPGKKDSNPKDRIGSTKVPLSLVPGTALSYAALAHLDGATKYGRWNWRIAGVRASIYLDAVLRHLQDWNNGEETASDGVHHLGHALACINILIDAKECGKLTDDRPPRAPMVRVFDEGKAEVRRIHERYEGMVVPRDFTIEDGVEGA